jgi:protein SCO1/2
MSESVVGRGVRRWATPLMVIGLLALALLALAATWVAGAFPRPYTFHGTQFEPVRPVADFTLTNQDGQPVRLSDYRGKLVVLFFGYTHCPDVCPTTLARLNQVMRALGDEAKAVQVLFVSVDPERDTPAVLKRFLSHFNPTFVGLTGQAEAVAAVNTVFGVYVNQEEVGSAAGYLVTHTARLYVIDRQGRLVLTYPADAQVEDIVADLKHLLEEGK